MGVKINCVVCGAEFIVKPSRRAKAKYCCLKCKLTGTKTGSFLACGVCGKEFWEYKSKIDSFDKHFCSVDCRKKYQKGSKHPNWKGGRFIDTQGYVVVRNSEYPKGTYEHRYNIEQEIGRKLLPNEHVHHKDEDKTNNDPSNLFIMSNSGHTKLHGKLNKWSKKHDKCICCESTKSKHHANGLCAACYARRLRENKKCTPQV